MEDHCLISELDGGILWLTLNRPAARNALNLALTRALAEQIARIDTDPAVKVAVITGTDPAFCAGLDIKDFSDANSPRHEVGAMINSVPLIQKPVIAAVNGSAMTGGLELALGCDFIIASDEARFADTHSKIGALAGSGLTARLPHRIGHAWAKQMSYSSIPIDAATAQRIGLVNEVRPHGELRAYVASLAKAIAGQNEMLVGTVKRVLDAGSYSTLADALRIEREALMHRKARGDMQWNKP
jgi:enoyl-CoA hydratase